MFERRKLVFVGLLVLILAGTIIYGIVHKHHFVVFVFGVWCAFEMALWGLSRASHSAFPRFGEVRRLGYLVQLYSNSDGQSDSLLEQTILELKLSGRLSELELRFLSRLSQMHELRVLTVRGNLRGKATLKQAFIFDTNGTCKALGSLEGDYSLQDIAEAAVYVAGLYRRVFEESVSKTSPLRKQAQRLLTELLGSRSVENLQVELDAITDAMQRDSGVPFLMLNLIRRGELEWAKMFGTRLLTSEYDLDEELRCALYWMGELAWFTKTQESPVVDHESTIRYLYHLCFTSPDRAGFLEIDSQFFSQFETVSELAREGFMFKEALIERIFDLWNTQSRFDSLFCDVLEKMTQQKSKIYDDRPSWELFWAREFKDFGKDYLYVVEGNLAFVSRHYQDARNYYEKALKLNPELRAARLNLLFCLAKLDEKRLHIYAQQLLQDKGLYPQVLFSIGNAHVLAGLDKRASAYFEELKSYPDWAHKTEYYRSVFCYEHGFFEKALEFAREAVRLNPTDTSMRYHLSLCFSSVGEKDQALATVRGLADVPQWVDYYRFRLERDSGQFQEASQTLLKIPCEYFQDPEELEEALEFARARKDLSLLRHLKSRG